MFLYTIILIFTQLLTTKKKLNMAKSKTTLSKPRVLITPGIHLSRCIGIIDVGTQETEYKGVKSEKSQIYYFFEITDQTHVFDEEKGPQRMTRKAGKKDDYTNSLTEKSNLLKMINGWRGVAMNRPEQLENYDLFERFIEPAMLNVIHTPDKTKADVFYDNIVAIMPVGKDVKVPAYQNPAVAFSLNDACYFHDPKETGKALLAKNIKPINTLECMKLMEETTMYGWVTKIIKRSPEWKELAGTDTSSLADDPDNQMSTAEVDF